MSSPQTASTAVSSAAPVPGNPTPTPVPPGYVAIMCPSGFTRDSVKDAPAAKALFARVVYQPK